MKHIYYKKYDEHVYVHTLKNGLTIFALPKQGMNTTYVALSIPFGSSHLYFKENQEEIILPQGSAHFFEHKIYASKNGDMFSRFVKLGLDPNAMTSYETTTYFFSSTEHIYEGIDLLFETLDEPYFTDENIANERSIINEEIHMDLDDVMTTLYQQLYKNMFFVHPIQYDILGTTDSIASIKKETLLWMHENLYQDCNKTLILSGNIDIESLETYIFNLEKSRPNGKNNIQLNMFEEPFQVVKTKEVIIKEMSISRMLIGIKLPMTEDEKTFHKMKQSLYIALHVMIDTASDIYQDWLKKGMIHQGIQYQISHVKGADHLTIQVPTHDPEDVLNDIESIIQNDIRSYLTIPTFDRLKKMMIASEILSLDDQENKLFQFLKAHLKGISMFERMDSLDTLFFEDVIHYGNQLKNFPRSVLIAKNK